MVLLVVVMGDVEKWDCVYEIDGYTYDLSSENKNSHRADGYYTSTDGLSQQYWWRMCEGTDDPPGPPAGANCDSSTFVCSIPISSGGLENSCGEGPPIASSLGPHYLGTGFLLTALGGNADGCSSYRSTQMSVLCADEDHPDGLTSSVDEYELCQYEVQIYLDSACGTVTNPPSPSPTPYSSPSLNLGEDWPMYGGSSAHDGYRPINKEVTGYVTAWSAEYDSSTTATVLCSGMLLSSTLSRQNAVLTSLNATTGVIIFFFLFVFY